MPEISTDLLHPTPLPIEAIHSLAALQFILLRYGDGEPFSTDNFPGWSLQFQYFPESDTSRAYLWPRSGETAKYIRFIGENNLNIPWFEIILPDGTAYPCAPVEIFNPQDPQNPQDGNEKLLLFPVFVGSMKPNQRWLFQNQYLSTKEKFKDLFKNRVVILAQEGGFFAKLNLGGGRDFFDPSSLDSLLGMEGNDVKEIPFRAYGEIYHFSDLFQEGFSGAQNSPQKIYERPYADDNPDGTDRYLPLSSEIQTVVLVISP